MRVRLALPIVLLLAPGAFCQTSGEDGFFKTRQAVIRAYGAASNPDLNRLYLDTSRQAEATPTDGLLFRRAAFAELAGLYAQEEAVLEDIIRTRRAGPKVVTFYIELLRARGSLISKIPAVLSAVDTLKGSDRIAAISAAANACMWSKPPELLLAAVREAAKGDIEVPDLILLAAALVSWGYHDEAAEILSNKASLERSGESLVVIAHTLNQINARSRARDVAWDYYSKGLPRAAGSAETLAELVDQREQALELAVTLAAETASFDMLLEKVSFRGKASDSAFVDYSLVLGEAGRLAEKAEVLRRLYEIRRDADTAAMYGNALIGAGDAYSTQNALAASVFSSPSLDEDPYLDLFDAVSILRDPQVLLQSASLFSAFKTEPQVARNMSEYARVLGDFRLSDRLFASFIMSSDLGPDTRFNWEGSRLLANYYLDTGRLDEGKAAAKRAIKQLLDVQGPREITRSSQPEKIAALFDRFNGVGELLDYCLSRDKDLPKSGLLLIIEQEAFERLGRWDDAWKVLARLNEKEPTPMRDVFLADSKSRAGDYDEAIRLYEKAIAADPRVPRRTNGDLMDLYVKTARWDDAERFAARTSSGADVWTFLGGFFSDAGQPQRARRAYERLADLTVDVASEQLGAAVRFLAESDPSRAADLLARRLSLQGDFWAKHGTLGDCMPEDARACAPYLMLAAALEKGTLAMDHRVISDFCRLLSVRAARLRDFGAARSAAEIACAHQPDSIENTQQLSRLTSGVDAARSEGIAKTISRSLPVPSVLIKLAEAQLGLKRTSEAQKILLALAAMPLSPRESHALAGLVAEFPVRGDALLKVRDSAASASWTLRARLADVLPARGQAELAGIDAKAIADGGTYVGRALWAADFYVRAGKVAEAGAVLELFRAISKDHPALVVIQADIARSRGDLTGASEIIASAHGAAFRPQFAALMRMETARVMAPSSD